MASDGERPGETPERIDTGRFVRSLFAGLATPDQRLVRHAGYILCQTVHSNDQLRPAIINGLAQWAVRQEHHESVLRTLATIQNRYDATVKRALLNATDRRQAGLLYDRLTTIRPWEVTFESEGDGEGETLVDVGGSGMVRVPREFLDRTTDAGAETTDNTTPQNAHLQTTSPDQKRNWSQFSRRKQLAEMPHGEEFATVEAQSKFDEFEFLGPETETRYSHSVRTRTLEGTREDVAIVRLYRNQEDGGFDRALGQQLDDWADTETPGVVGVADWGESPRPWAVTEFTEQTLWERGKLSPEEGLRTALDLTASLAQLHQRDRIHGGIDPHCVRYTPAIFGDRPQPMIDNVGLIPIYRQFDNPASYTDPRYAAPEYFTEDHGIVSHATDIYQLGMTLYSAFTGDPPYEGDLSDLRRQILRDRPLGLSPDNPDLPGPIAEILAKATAREKIARYETATQFHSAVRNACDALL
ncbi:hypothetical protein GRX03_07770 [Halovenus sp. WSH3]|uniref:Protein kinase domain-containing protein n=1 Tax=Halovenus carboxidivorans TaxID=2692199 RepID=A0A6B0T9G2_9EURY|nr:hypothetical protein [Halovenus carboxidivorans]MXR51500.1 hypothetical protein [Halovenus carboxidivorans]